MTALVRFRQVRKLFILLVSCGCRYRPDRAARVVPAPGSQPCDIYGAAGTSCVAAYSALDLIERAVVSGAQRAHGACDGATANVGLLAAYGYGNAAVQDIFCAPTTCVVTELYDQSPKGNNRTIEGTTYYLGQDAGSNAAALPVMVGGHPEYGLDFPQKTGYRNNGTSVAAVSGAPEGMYMVASGTHVNRGCCFDFGNAEPSITDTGGSPLDAGNLTTYCEFGPCTGSGPWVQADLETASTWAAMAGTRTMQAATATSSPRC